MRVRALRMGFLVIGLCYAGIALAGAAAATAEVFYVEFGAQTYSFVTRSNIAQYYVRRGDVNTDNPDFKRVLAILSHARVANEKDLPFNENYVVLRIRARDLVVYVDSLGRIEGSYSNRILSEGEMTTLHKLIASDSMTDPRTIASPP